MHTISTTTAVSSETGTIAGVEEAGAMAGVEEEGAIAGVEEAGAIAGVEEAGVEEAGATAGVEEAAAFVAELSTLALLPSEYRLCVDSLFVGLESLVLLLLLRECLEMAGSLCVLSSD